ncbi:hypothetical protein BDY19DRAFT_951689 [Irpex rosettiformis]|uniref:Uncharacterized protein n=1 Tax=Irpex rosettiformis TaxID=378272 RepID=A0ACB8U1E4_9APHY|nr:hypothetical protein BDY19DRAFT_951689 [Irpex rosettiformis]
MTGRLMTIYWESRTTVLAFMHFMADSWHSTDSLTDSLFENNPLHDNTQESWEEDYVAWSLLQDFSSPEVCHSKLPTDVQTHIMYSGRSHRRHHYLVWTQRDSQENIEQAQPIETASSSEIKQEPLEGAVLTLESQPELDRPTICPSEYAFMPWYERPKKPRVKGRKNSTAIACLFCRHRKIRCGGPQSEYNGTCKSCVHYKRDCVFPSQSFRGRRVEKASKLTVGSASPQRDLSKHSAASGSSTSIGSQAVSAASTSSDGN